MKISELIKQLEILKDLHGDIDVLIYGSYGGGAIDYIHFNQNGASPCIELLNDY